VKKFLQVEDLMKITCKIDEYIENRVYAIAAFADEVIARVKKWQLGQVAEI